VETTLDGRVSARESTGRVTRDIGFAGDGDSRKRTSTIVVAGDVCIDWLAYSVEAVDPETTGPASPLNYRLKTGTRMVARPGGALLLSRLVQRASAAKVVTHQLDELEIIPPEDVIHSIIELDCFAYSADDEDEKHRVYRVKRFAGFAGPLDGPPPLRPVFGDDRNAAVVVIDDAGNGFRDVEDAWPRAVKLRGKHPIVLLKMSRPLAEGALWERLHKSHRDRLVVVVSANDLRAEGLKISRRLSWERTATDFVWQIASNPRLLELADCASLVVRFGIDGAIRYVRTAGRVETRLYYDPAVAEDGFKDDCPGDMSGFTSAFVAALAARIAKQGLPAVGQGIRDGLRSSRRLFREGFGRSTAALDYPGEGIFGNRKRTDPVIADIPVPLPTSARTADPNFWCILEELSEEGLEELAYQIVRRGEASALRTVPIGSFGALRTVDRAEIESLRSIRNLMLEYLARISSTRALSIAVFGPPGSGKSFAVTEVASSIGEKHFKSLSFNVAQFTSPTDLVRAFHRVRDVSLTGKIPLVFFDEFDCAFEGGKLGWLKYFLTPMQDGEFRDGDVVHPIGRAIFVFAGGTSPTFATFAREELPDDAPTSGPDAKRLRERLKKAKDEFVDAKGPDFASRLRGYVNILGPNPRGEDEVFFLIRRAMLFRSQLERKAKHLVDGGGQAQIDEGVLRALLKVPEYKHGARSMEAIIEMSMLEGRRSFEQASLPPAEQLELHVDAEQFSQLVIRDALFGAVREVLARAIHEKYRSDRALERSPDDRAMRPWEELDEDLKESNLQQADDIRKKLRRIRFGFAAVTEGEPTRIKLTQRQVDVLAEMEHERWMDEKRRAGWTYGKRKSAKRKTHPSLVAWKELSADVKKIDRDTVRGMPEFMAGAGFEIYRLDSRPSG
jgi:hypothetical protein